MVSGAETDEGRFALAQHIPARALTGEDEGPLESGVALDSMSLLLKPSEAQQTALDQLLREQLDPKSANYHKWITPEEFGKRFGVSDEQVQRLTDWLKGSGLQVTSVAQGRLSIEFAGTHASVQKAFGTLLHRVRVSGIEHFANVSAPSIPKEFAGLVGSVRGLNDFRPKRAGVPYPAASAAYLGPAALGQIYGAQNLTSSGLDGSGIAIVVAGQAAISLSDYNQFRSLYGLSGSTPRVVNAGGVASTDNDDQFEAALDVQLAGALAQNAQVVFVQSNDAFRSVEYAIDQNLGPIISVSYGGCESEQGSYMDSFRTQVQQANSEGITLLASSGDAGPAACDWDPDNRHNSASGGLSVNFPASVPEVTAVGGTQFNEIAPDTWSTQSQVEAQYSYVPEIAWNNNSTPFAASGGGPSAHFSKPVWQLGPGVPNDGQRDLPDLALTASWDHDPYGICFQGYCVEYIGGTSASTPTFASLLALILQYETSHGVLSQPRLGNLNALLYNVAQNSPAAFPDITLGDNHVPCNSGSADCTNGQYLGYEAGPGYDLTTGLGSVDAYNLALGIQYAGTSRSQATITVSSSGFCLASWAAQPSITAQVSWASGPAPTGTVYFYVAGDNLLASSSVAAGSATASVPGNLLFEYLDNGAGPQNVFAVYSGDANYLGSISPTASVDITSYSGGLALSVVPQVFPLGTTVRLVENPDDACSVVAGSVTFQYSTGASWANIGTIPAGSTGAAALSTSQLPAGSYDIQVTGSLPNQAGTVSTVAHVSVMDETRQQFGPTVVSGAVAFPLYLCSPDGEQASQLDLSANSVAYGPDGTIYFSDINCGSLRKINPSGVVSTVEGGINANQGGVAVAPDGTVYFINGGVLDKLGPNSSLIQIGSSVSCNTAWPANINGLSAAGLCITPTAIAVDSGGDLIVGDSLHSEVYEVTPSGTLKLIAGGGSQYQDGKAASTTSIGFIPAVAADNQGNIYYADNQWQIIREVTTDGIVHTVAGIYPPGTESYSYTGHPDGPALTVPLVEPNALVAGIDGSLYIGDSQAVWRLKNGYLQNISNSLGTGLDPSPVALTQSPTGQILVSGFNLQNYAYDVLYTLTPYSQLPTNAMRFVPITPCRVVDTRLDGSYIARGGVRDVDFLGSPCGIPNTAQAYSTNVAVVPHEGIGYLTAFPAGGQQPYVATLNSTDGRVKSNAAILTAGASGQVSFFSTGATDLVVDINGYFVPATDGSALAFYPMTPCRIADTRKADGPFGGPGLGHEGTRNIPVLSSACNVPSAAKAYVISYAVVPPGELGYLTTWPGGTPQPYVSTLNDLTGTVVANDAIVPAGADGSVNIFADQPTQVVMDITGYFAAPGAGGLSYYVVSPCRAYDSRQVSSQPLFGTTPVGIVPGPCDVPITAQAYVLNVTVVPPHGLGYLTLWPDGQPMPLASTLNATDGAVTNNMAMIPSSNGLVDVYAPSPTHVVIDMAGYFAP